VHVNVLFFANYDPDATAEAVFEEYRRWNERHAHRCCRSGRYM